MRSIVPRRLLPGALVALAAALAPVPAAFAAKAAPSGCYADGTGTYLLASGAGGNVTVATACRVVPGTYRYGNINIVQGGSLTFTEARDSATHLYTSGIVIEAGGALLAGGDAAKGGTPFGTNGGRLVIHLWGKDQGVNPGGQGTACVQKNCGIPDEIWTASDAAKVPMPGGAPDDWFYQYGPLPFDGAGAPMGYFGYKSIGVSYDGTLQLFGAKGATYGPAAADSAGTSWVRLAVTAKAQATTLVLERPVDWAAGDEIVVTTTDYLPGHSEQRTIQAIGADKRTLTLAQPLAYRHQGERYALPNDPDLAKLGLGASSVETRAAVALLTRSIRIVSEGDTLDTAASFPAESTGYHFGGHTVVRQGFRRFQVQGVEFRQLGQGGRIGHYPVHFHMARNVPPDTFVKDTSVNESMTRWYVLHATSGVTFARNVGWKSIGHGYYIEDGTETDNVFQSNIGIYARPAIVNATVNPRSVPGILAAPYDSSRPENVPFYSDVDHPTVFWIMNGWNDFEYNFAAGAGGCGACYWLVPGAASGHSRHMKFEGYASMQQTMDPNPLLKAATTPLRKFVGNSCTTAMNSFNTIGNTTACYGIGGDQAPFAAAVPNPNAPPWCYQNNDPSRACNSPQYETSLDYYPLVDQGGGRFATICNGGDCSATPRCASANLASCMVTVLDRYTSSFHWTETNFAAVWLRPQWYLFTDSALTDVQNGGLTMITGGGYTESDVVKGHWALTRRSVFVGNTQDPQEPGASAFARNAGPFNPDALPANGSTCSGNHCLAADEGVSFPLSNFGVYQRLFNIYDGPAYQDSNAYLDIAPTPIADCTLAKAGAPDQVCDSRTLAGRVLGLPWDKAKGRCYMPNAAIGWKQPNGFYYPPAFHSANLVFAKVDIRHFVIEPLFTPGTYRTDTTASAAAYCNFNSALFNGFTDIDRQTELSDDDGSLTGYKGTVSVNLDPFFNAPVEAVECASDATAKTSPYDYVSTVLYPGCASTNSCTNWSQTCSNQFCAGVPLYRQRLVKGENSAGAVRMAGQDNYQRSTLSVNNGTYYVDTSQSKATQDAAGYSQYSEFQAGGTYYLFDLFAKASTTQTFQIYVGPGFAPATDVWATRADVRSMPLNFPAAGALPWPAGWSKSYANGVLTVTMTMNFPEFAANYKAAFADRCQPASFCSWTPSAGLPTGGTCGCNASGLNAAACAQANPQGENVCAWTQKDVDCPSGGCYGIGFKLPAGFTRDPAVSPRPAGTCVKAGEPGWDVQWQAPTVGAGTCNNAPVLPNQFCN